MELKSFLNGYDTIIFDMDGVITSEQNYWNAAALTVWEFLESGKYYGEGEFSPAAALESLIDIRKSLFCGDEIITALKERGVNSNWDLAYIVFCAAVANAPLSPIANGGGALELYSEAAERAAAALNRDIGYTRRGGELWLALRDAFQEWYLGDEGYESLYGRRPRQEGKPGLCREEKPIIGLDLLKSLLAALNERGKRLCIATGRPRFEMLLPLRLWGIENEFDPDGLCSFDAVERAERETGISPLSKPHPYIFIKAALGLDFSDKAIVGGDYPKGFDRVLTVGDSGADALAANAMGADFAAVLTGISGGGGRDYFKEQNAKYILNSLSDFFV